MCTKVNKHAYALPGLVPGVCKDEKGVMFANNVMFPLHHRQHALAFDLTL